MADGRAKASATASRKAGEMDGFTVPWKVPHNPTRGKERTATAANELSSKSKYNFGITAIFPSYTLFWHYHPIGMRRPFR